MIKHTRIRRAFSAICPDCMGGGFRATKNGAIPCPECKGTGSVEKWLTEIVVADEKEITNETPTK